MPRFQALKKSERARLIFRVPGNKVRISGPHWGNGDLLLPSPHDFIASVPYQNLILSFLEHVLQKWEEASSYIFPDWKTMLRTWTAEIHCNLCDGCYTDGYAYRVGVSSFCGRDGGHFVLVIMSSSQNSLTLL